MANPTHGRNWQMARYELPVEEVERTLANGRFVVDIVVGAEESLAYVNRNTGKRVEYKLCVVAIFIACSLGIAA